MNNKQIKYPEFLMIDSLILQNIGQKKNALKVLVLIWVIRKSKTKGSVVETSEVLSKSKLPKSSFYQALKDLEKLGYVKVLKKSKLSLITRLHYQGKEFIKLTKDQLQNLKSISGHQMLVAFRIHLIIKNKQPKESYKFFRFNQRKIGYGFKNEAIHDMECFGGVKCCEDKMLRVKFEEKFTFKVFKNIFLKIRQIGRILKSKNLKAFLETFGNIQISYFRESKNKIVKTIHKIFMTKELKISR